MFGWFRDFVEWRATLRNPVAEWLADSVGGSTTDSGERITSDTAMNVSTAWACVQVLMDAVSCLPLFLYQRQRPRGKRRADDHYLYTIVHDHFNEDMTTPVALGAIMVNALVYGNGYGFIERNQAGEVESIMPWSGAELTPTRNDRGQLVYERQVKPGSERLTYRPDQILHLTALSFDGITGQSPIARARQTLGIAMAGDKAAAATFKHGGRGPGVIKHPHRIKPEEHKFLRESWDAVYGKAESTGKTIILEQGTEYQPISFSAEDSQFLESRRFSVEEICRWYKVPPHMVGHLDRATFSNIEHQAIEFVVHSLRPWLVRLEREMAKKFLSEEERRRYFIEFKIDGLLRGDSKTRAEVFAIYRQWGLYSIDDGREIENLNPIEGEGGDTHLEPMNMRPVGEEPEPPEPDVPTELPTDDDDGAPPVPPVEPTREHLVESFRPIIRDACGRIVKVECDKLRRAYKRHEDFGQWRADFYPRHEQVVADALRAPVTTLATMTGANGSADGLAERLASKYVATSTTEINATFDLSGDRNLAFGELLSAWESDRADTAATMMMDEIRSVSHDET